MVSGLPANGATLYIRLHTYMGAWHHNDYTVAAATLFGGQPAQLISPAQGSTLSSTTVNFQWTSGTGATQYWLHIGTSPGASNILSRDLGTSLSTVVSGLPVNGATLYVRLHTYIGAWHYNDYTVAAPLINGLKAQLISPAPGSTLDSTSVNFQWTGGTGATQYWLYIGSAPGTFDIVFRNLNTSLNTVVHGLPSGGQLLYVRLFSHINGVWMFNDYVLISTTGG
jgi:serine protease